MRCLCAVFIAWIAQAAGLVFEPNAGQTDPNIRFLARTRESSIAISASEIAIRAGSARVHLQFVDSEPMVLEGLDRQPGVVNYLIGNDPKRWLRRIPTYARITSRNLYPGVDILFHGTGTGLEYDFELAPGADASRIGLKFTGAQSVRVDEQGDLVIGTAAGELRQKKPLISQESDGHRQVIDGRYRLIGDGQVAVDIASYDRRRRLVIDPELIYAVHVGGSGVDQVNAIATDSQGNTYITGQTNSLNFPVNDAFESEPKVSPLYRSDVGGPLTEIASVEATVSAIAVEPSNSAIAYFGTAQGLFKTTDAGAHATLLAGWLPAGATIGPIALDPSNASTAYVAAYSSLGNGLGVYKTTDGGADWAAINNGLNTPQGIPAITQLYVDPTQPSHLFAENTFTVAFRSTDGGATWVPFSFNYGFLTFDPGHPGTVYASIIEPVGTPGRSFVLSKSTDGGNTWTELDSSFVGSSLAIDPFHSGTLWSSQANAANGVYRSTDGGQTWSGTNLRIQTSEVAADPVVPNTIYALTANSLYKTTDAGATWVAFGPANLTTFALAPDERMYAGGSLAVEAFVTKLDPSGQNLVYSTYIGGSVNDQAIGIAVDQQGNAYVTGTTLSPDFPTTSGASNASATGAFMLRLNPAGDTLGYSVIVADQMTLPAGIAVDPNGNAYITGSTTGDLPVTAGAYFTTPPAGEDLLFFSFTGSDAFALKLNASGALSYATYANEARVGGMFGVIPIGYAIAVDASGSAYITGGYFLLKFNASGSGLVYSAPTDPWGAGGYLGTAIALDAKGNAYVAGGSDYGHAYVSKFDADGHTVFNTGNGLLAGEGTEFAQGVAVDSAGNVFVAGPTTSQGFPLRGPVQEAFSQASSFLAELDSSANLIFSTYVGDTSFFGITGLALDPSRNPVFCGNTYTGSTSLVDGVEFYPGASVYVAKYDASGVPALRLDSLSNLASQLPVPVSPGELVAIKGAGFAADAQLFLNGVAATMIPDSGSGAPMAIVPSALSGLASALAHVESGGQSSNAVLVPIAAAAPGIFTVSGTGKGQALAFNQDGTPNSQAHPAPVGSMVTFYATGVGQTVLAAKVYIVYIGYGDAYNYIAASSVQFSFGPAPGLPADVLADVLKVQATVPVGIYSPGAVPVEIVENGVPSQAGVTIWISH